MQKGEFELSFVIVDVTETPIERPKKNSSVTTATSWTKRHLSWPYSSTVLSKTAPVLALKQHRLGQNGTVLGRTRTTVAARYRACSLPGLSARKSAPRQYGQSPALVSLVPKSTGSSRRWKLEPYEKQHNKALTKLRLSIEHVNAKLRVFRILKEHYRCRRSRFGLRFNLIAGFYNFELVLSS